ncbi:MAG: hypothetical protein JW866_00030 [Ignavibacteriales bacterium]|nr:hypothetical protein [Ignavibacteriales bacterium]
MSVDSGYLVETKTGKEGRTYHREGLVNKKMVVHVEINGKDVKILCDPKTIKIIGFVD